MSKGWSIDRLRDQSRLNLLQDFGAEYLPAIIAIFAGFHRRIRLEAQSWRNPSGLL
jgi:hypothetical protein